MAAQRLIKKYPNRRLYDMHRSRYIVLADIRALIREGVEVQVVDSQDGDDITRSILLQIVTDREAGPDRLLTTDMLIRWIRCCDVGSDAFFAHMARSLASSADTAFAPSGVQAGVEPQSAPANGAGIWRESRPKMDLGPKES